MYRQICEAFEDRLFPYKKNRLTEAWVAYAPQRYEGCSWYLEPIARNKKTGVYEMTGWGASDQGSVQFTVTVVGKNFKVSGEKLDLNNTFLRNVWHSLCTKECEDVWMLFAHLNTITAFLKHKRNVCYRPSTDLAHRRRTSWLTWRSLWETAAWIWTLCTQD